MEVVGVRRDRVHVLQAQEVSSSRELALNDAADHDTTTSVPLPGSLATVTVAPMRSPRSRMLARPTPSRVLPGSKPAPLSRTLTETIPPCIHRPTSMTVAAACLRAF